MRTVILLSIFLSLMIPSCGTLGITDAPHITTAKMVWLMTDANGGTCSAFPVFCEWDPQAQKYRTLFLTVKHGIEGPGNAGPYSLEDCNGTKLLGGRYLATHSEDDLGLVVILSDTPLPCASYTSSNPTLGDTIYVAGWPAGRHLHVTQGLMSALSNCGSAQAYFGNSGGAVMDSWGRVVGVVDGMGGSNQWGPIPHMMFYVPLTEARIKWLESFRDLLVSSP